MIYKFFNTPQWGPSSVVLYMCIIVCIYFACTYTYLQYISIAYPFIHIFMDLETKVLDCAVLTRHNCSQRDFWVPILSLTVRNFDFPYSLTVWSFYLSQLMTVWNSDSSLLFKMRSNLNIQIWLTTFSVWSFDPPILLMQSFDLALWLSCFVWFLFDVIFSFTVRNFLLAAIHIRQCRILTRQWLFWLDTIIASVEY
jgi:hypothetical protein